MNRTAIIGFASLILLSSGAFLFGPDSEPQRIGANLLVVSYGLLGLGLGGAALLALLFVTGARWSDLIRPAAEKLTLLLPVGVFGVAVVLIGWPSLYPWTRDTHEAGSHFQTLWLNRPFFLLRALIYFTLWIGLVFLLVRASQQQSAGFSNKSGRISACYLVVFALTSWLASVDWIMSLEPQWSSTIFGVYHFTGMFLGALAAVIALAVWFDRRGVFAGRLTRNHFRDLGTLLFSFSSFWMYIWFSQYLLIWYVNNPEEAEYFVRRQQFDSQQFTIELGEYNVNIWQPLLIANLALNWGAPFLVLLFRSAKESPVVLFLVALTVLCGRWLDLYLMVLPPVVGSKPGFVAWDAGLLLGAVGLAGLIFALRSPLRTGTLNT